MKSKLVSSILAGLILTAAVSTYAAVQVGEPVPNFSLPASNGKTVSLSDYIGKLVVLEWTQPGCPIVAKHYDSNNMQNLQKKYVPQSVVWISINSSAEGKQGYCTPEMANEAIAKRGAAPTVLLLDHEGTVARLYAAKTTPHMYIISPAGVLLYNGAIDSIHSNKPSDVPLAKNYVSAALDEILAGQPVTITAVTPYGCSIKFADPAK